MLEHMPACCIFDRTFDRFFLLLLLLLLMLLLLQAEIGIDAGAYARLLMAHAKDAAELVCMDDPATQISSQDILEAAYYRTNVQGGALDAKSLLMI